MDARCDRRKPMAKRGKPKAGAIVWHDLTVPDAVALRDFYASVVGWRHDAVDMGGYSDFTMMSPGSRVPAAGICHSRGVNAKLPPQWLVYVQVEDLDGSLKACVRGGGQVVDGPRGMGEQRFAIVKDPAGAHLGLIGSR
jgi:predicted enzyme related to lactoylglutathione lyase